MSGGYDLALWGLLIAASITDLVWGKIYNVLTLSSIAAGILFRLCTGPTSSVTAALIAVACAFAFFFPLYLIKALAAADVKLLMAVGAWSDFKFVLHMAVLSIFMGALVGLVVILKKRGLKNSAIAVASQLDLKHKERAVKPIRMPFGPAFLCSFIFLRIAELKGWNF